MMPDSSEKNLPSHIIPLFSPIIIYLAINASTVEFLVCFQPDCFILLCFLLQEFYSPPQKSPSIKTSPLHLHFWSFAPIIIILSNVCCILLSFYHYVHIVHTVHICTYCIISWNRNFILRPCPETVINKTCLCTWWYIPYAPQGYISYFFHTFKCVEKI